MLDPMASTDATAFSKAITTTAKLAQLRNDGKTLTTQELKELNARVKALEEMAYIEDRLRLLENKKRSRADETLSDQSINESPTPTAAIQRPSRRPTRGLSSSY